MQNSVEEVTGVKSGKAEIDAKSNEIEVELKKLEMKEKAEVPTIGEHDF